MSTLQSNPSVSRHPRTILGTGLVVLGVLIAIAVSIIFIALAGANHTTRNSTATHKHTSSGYVPLIHSHGTGAHPQLASIAPYRAGRTTQIRPLHEMIDNRDYRAP